MRSRDQVIYSYTNLLIYHRYCGYTLLILFEMLSNSTLAWALTEWLSVGSLVAFWVAFSLWRGRQYAPSLPQLAHSSSESEGGSNSNSVGFTLLVTLALFWLLAGTRNFIWGVAGCLFDIFFNSFCGGNFFRVTAPDARLLTFDSSILSLLLGHYLWSLARYLSYSRLKLRDDVVQKCACACLAFRRFNMAASRIWFGVIERYYDPS